MRNHIKIGKDIGRRKKTIFKITTPILSTVLLVSAVSLFFIRIESSNADYHYVLHNIKSDINELAIHQHKIFKNLDKILGVELQELMDNIRFVQETELFTKKHFCVNSTGGM